MRVFYFLIIIFFLTTCKRDWNNPLSIDDDLKTIPSIVSVETDSDHNILINLNYAYSDSSEVVLERKSKAAFELIDFDNVTPSTLIDSTFDKEISHNFSYRFKIRKGKYETVWSAEKNIQYESTFLNKPRNFQARSIEMQGIELSWSDKSNYEESYKIEKNDGSGYVELASLSANTESYFYAIADTPSAPLQFSFRIMAYSSTFVSDWNEISTTYSGIGSPSNLIISNPSTFRFTIQWTDNSVIETNNSVERKKDDGPFEEVALLDANVTQFIDTLTETGLYSYRVRAVAANIYSSYSNTVTYDVTDIIPGEGLIAYYPLDGTANDESGNNFNGTANGLSLTANRHEEDDKAFFFDGNNHYIEIPFISAMYPDEISVSLWVSFAEFKNEINVIRAGDSHTDGWRGYNLYYYYTEFGWDDYTGSGYNARVVYPVSGLELDTWYHVVITRSLATAKMYINGTLVDQDDGLSPYAKVTQTALYFGRNEPGHETGYFRGRMDDIRIYNRSLTPEEVEALYLE